MSGPQPTAYAEGNVLADSSDYRLRLVTAPLLLFGGSNLRTGLDLRGVETNFQAKVGWRSFSVDASYPSSAGWQQSTNVRSTSDEFVESFDVSSTTDLLVQGALFTSLSTGSTGKLARARLWASVVDAGWVVARQRVVLMPGASNVVVPIGNPFSAAGVSGLMVAIVYTGVSGTISSPTPCWRAFKTGDTTNPGSWSALTAGSNVTADTRTNNNGEAITTSSAMMAQGGFKYSTTSSTYGVADLIFAAKS